MSVPAPPDGGSNGPVLLAFVGHAADGAGAAAYEDAVLPLLADHGARVVFRGRRRADQDPSLAAEVHLLWFPARAALDAYLADDRRLALRARFGEVFSRTEVVELDVVEGPATFDI